MIDANRDGKTDGVSLDADSIPEFIDLDGDGVSDIAELEYGTNPNSPASSPFVDSDQDGVPDYENPQERRHIIIRECAKESSDSVGASTVVGIEPADQAAFMKGEGP